MVPFVSGDAMPHQSAAYTLERLAGDLHALAFDWAEPSRSIPRLERMIAEAERIAAEVRKAVRG